jgi:hypothetical protein
MVVAAKAELAQSYMHQLQTPFFSSTLTGFCSSLERDSVVFSFYITSPWDP